MAKKHLVNSITLVYCVMSEDTAIAKIKTFYSYSKQKVVSYPFFQKSISCVGELSSAFMLLTDSISV